MNQQPLLHRLDFTDAEVTSGSFEVFTPIDGARIAAIAMHSPADVNVADRTRGGGVQRVARRTRAAARRTGAAVRRGTARSEARSRRTGHGRVRQDPAGRSRRSAGDDRHLRLRGRSVAPALRTDDGVRTARPRDARNVAPGRRVRHHHRVQLPGGAVVLERGAGDRLRRSGDLEAVGKDAAVGARHAEDLRPRASPVSTMHRTRCRR